MRVTVVCDGSKVIAGVKETIGAIKLRVPPVLNWSASDGTMKALEFLEESFVRPDWTQSGQLARAIFDSMGGFNKATWSSGIGNIRILNAQAHYWSEIEEGTKSLMGTYRGYFIDESGGTHGPSRDRDRFDKWINVGSGGHLMEVKKPITAHNYFEKTWEDSRTSFPAKMISMMNEVFA